MKLAITLFFYSLITFAGELSTEDFKVKKYGKDYFLQKKDRELKLYKIERAGMNSKVTQIIHKKEAKDLYFVVYLDSFAGTSTTATFYRAVIWNNNKKLFIGDVPYETVVNEGAPKGEKKEKAQWVFKKGTLEVFKEGEKIKEITY